jgi:hypothetical protein
MPLPDGIVSRMSDVINDLSLLFANEPDAAFVQAIKLMRAELHEEYGDLIERIPETTAFVDRVLECAVIQRHDIQINSGAPSMALH